MKQTPPCLNCLSRTAHLGFGVALLRRDSAKQEDPKVINRWFDTVRATIQEHSIHEDDNWNFDDTKDPLLSATYVAHTKKKIGTIAVGDLAKFETECCNAVAPPGSQVTLSGKRKDPSKPLYPCNHWLDDVIKLAFQKGIFKA
ncbi:hypothetical protein BBP40_002897 [Aspergillus hancockii]|nr:hypothetical protein BBP40_002897 [Aspergillus hancockii]